MRKKLTCAMILAGIMMISLCGMSYAEVDGFGNEIIAPGSQTQAVDFLNITKGLYYDGNDYYYVMDQGVPATNYLLNLHGDKYYFGDDGKMVKDDMIEYEDEKYYFDPNGTMVKNAWLTHEEKDDDGSIESVTYYFGPNGRAYRAKDRWNNMVIKTIDGAKYGFNDNAVRMEGYVSVDGSEIEHLDEEAIDQILYYFDPEEDYAAASGWILYNGERPEELDDGEEIYFYFDEKTGKKVSSGEPGKYITRVIEGERYLFDYAGVRQKKWFASPSNAGTPRYYNEDYEGFLSKGWFMAVPAASSVETKNQQYHRDEEDQWFYAARDGKIIRSTIKKIGHYYYCFDRDGVMQYNCLVAVDGNSFVASYKLDDITRKQAIMSADEGGILTQGQKWMYFTEPENEDQIGAMCKTNKNLYLELGDDTVVFMAKSNGGYGSTLVYEPVERNSKYYQNGILLKPLEDSKYGVVRKHKNAMPEVDDYCVVAKSGNKVQRGAFKTENNNFIVAGPNGTYYGTYNFEKCKVGTVNGVSTCVAEVAGGAEVRCPLDQVMTTFKDYLVTDSTYSYLNFNTWEAAPAS